MSRLMVEVTCHLSRLIGNPYLALAQMATTLKPSRNRSLWLLSRTRRKLTLLSLDTSTRISDAPCLLYLSLYGHRHPDHRVPSSHVCRRMMCLKPLEVTRPSLAHRCTSPCNGSSHNARLRNDGKCSVHSLYKGLWVKHRWWLDIASWTTSMSPTSTCHLHMSNGDKFIKFLSQSN